MKKMTTFDTNDPRNIWVSPDSDSNGTDSGTGTYDNPFPGITDALKNATPGQSIILLPGVYSGNLTIEISGSENAPIYITAGETGKAIVDGGCWYFYDTSDLIVSGLTFKNARRGAVSVVGQCLRNRFYNMDFIDCGTGGKASCAFYFGGAGARFNIVENCNFLRSASSDNPAIEKLSTENAAVGLMISDGGDGAYLTNHIIRRNRFSGYDKAVILGAENDGDFESGHIV
ncbi:MAG: DUF1565 domain-containing protein, partial [Chitinispirillales bacterium]|nr:DUF1565 domain-containing protein [Chitinispirillales bacterium]